MSVPFHLRQQVIRRARDRCEYCGLAQEGQEATFHVDHIIPTVAGGRAALDNLAFACVSCSLRKGARQEAIDPMTGKPAALFHPRTDLWRLHFRWDGLRVVGLSPTGRATVDALAFNRLTAQAIRLRASRVGDHPPPDHL